MTRTSLRALHLTAASGLALLALAACGGDGDGGGNASAGTNASATATEQTGVGSPKSGGTITFAQVVEPTCLDPVVSGDMNQATFAQQYLDSLVSTDEDGKITPWLATSWKLSADEKTYTFKLQDGVKFTDGTPLDAEAVKANFDRIVKTTGSSAQYLLYVQRSTAVDASTFRVTLKRRFAPFLQQIAQSFIGIQSPKAFARGETENCKSPVGSGPFIVQDYKPGEQAVLVRNPDYNSPPAYAKNRGPVHLDRVVWRFIPDATARFSAVRTGQIAAADGLAPINEVAARKEQNLTVLTRDYAGYAPGATFSSGKAPFDDVRVRQAFLHGADIDGALKSALFGLYQRPGVLSPTTTDFDPAAVSAYPYDVEKANRLLDEAGWKERNADGYRVKDGKPLKVRWAITADGGPGSVQGGNYNAIATQIQQTEREVGFQVELVDIPPAEAVERLWTDQYELAWTKWTLNSPDALRVIFDHEDGGFENPEGARFKDPEFNDLVERAAASGDPAERKELYRQAQQRFSDQAYGFSTFADSVRIVIDDRKVQGVRLDPVLGQLYLGDAWVLGDS